MSERLSDEHVRRIASVLRAGFTPESKDSLDEIASALDELLALRAKLSAGPVMPEVPSDDQWNRMADRLFDGRLCDVRPIGENMAEDAAQGATELPDYAIVEIFGHRRLAGEVREVERYGTKMLRIDVPIDGDFGKGVNTQYYGGGSIFSETPCDLATVQKMNTPYREEGRYSLSAPDDDGYQDW